MSKYSASGIIFVNCEWTQLLHIDGSFWIDFPTIIIFIIAIFLSRFRFLEFVSLLRVLRLGRKYIVAIEENFNL
jgi:hypothetical protein